MNRTVEIKNTGLIKSAKIDIKKINIIIGSCMKSEVMQLLYRLLYLEKKIYSIYNLNEGCTDSNAISFISTELKKNYSRFLLLIQSPLKIKSDGYIKYTSDWLEYTIYSDKIEINRLKWDLDLPDYLWYNSDPYFSIDRDKTLDPKFPTEWLDVEEPSFAFEKRMQSIVSEIVGLASPSEDNYIRIMSLRDHGYSSLFLVKEKDDLRQFLLQIIKYPEEKENVDDDYTLNGEFQLEQQLPHQLLPLKQDGLRYLIPIVLTIEKRVSDEIVDSVFIEEPELGLFPPIANLLIKNLIDDLTLRESESKDPVDVDLNWRPTLFMTTNSELVINSVLEDSGTELTKLPKGSVNIVTIQRDETAPLDFLCNSISEESIDNIYNGLDCFYNINSLD